MSFALVFLQVQTVNAQAVNKPPVIDAYITQVDPLNLNMIRVNIQNSNDPDGKIVKTEINVNGNLFSNMNEVYYTEPITNRWSFTVPGRLPKLYSLKGQIPVEIKIWDNKNAMTTKTFYVDANNEIKLQDNLLNKPLNLINVNSAKKYNFNVAAADVDKKYFVTFNRIKKTNMLQNLLGQLLGLFGINSPLNTFSGQVNINGIDVLKADEISQSTTQIKKFIAVKSANSIITTFVNSQYNQVDLEIHEVLYLKETNLPIITANVKSNSVTNVPVLIFNIQDESSIFWEANVNGTIYNQAITKSGGFQLDFIVNVNTFSVTARDIFGNITNFNLQNITQDIVPPQIVSKSPSSGSIKYTNQLPFNSTVNLQFNEAVNTVTIGGVAAQISSDDLSASFQASNISAGLINLAVVVTDLAGNVTNDSVSFEIIFNDIAPVISVQTPTFTLQNKSVLNLDFSVNSSIATTTTIKLNNVEISVSDLKNFANLPIKNLIEGMNTIVITSFDAAGNISLPQKISVQVDSIAAQLTNFSPVDNLQIYTKSLPYTVPIRLEFDEPITNATVDLGSGILVGSNVFEGQVVVNASGAFAIHMFATDLAGNVTEITKNIYVHFSDKLPVLTFNPSISNILTNLPRVDISGSSDQLLASILVNGSPMAIGLDGKAFSGFFDAVSDGVHQIEIVATDIFGNVTTSIQRVRVIVNLPEQLIKYAPTLVKTPTGYRIDYGPLFNGPDKDSICGALDQVFAAIPEAYAALDEIDHIKADIDKYKEYVPDIVTRNSPDTSGVRKFIGNVEEPLNRIKGAYLSICKNVDILPALDCPGDRILFSMIMGKFPEEYIIRQMTFIPVTVQDVLIPRTNLCTGFDDSGLTCDEMIKLTPLIGEIFSPAVAEVMSSPIAQGVMNILLCEDLCAAPAVKDTPILCKDFEVAGFPRIKKMPTRFNFGGPGGGISMDWGGSSGCGGFFNSCGGSGGSGGSGSCGWFDSCGGVGSDGSINGRDFACGVFPSLWFCNASNPVAATPPTTTTIVNIQPVPVCDPGIKLIDLINANPQNSTMIVSRYLATCMPSAVPFLPDIKKPVITVTSPAQNTAVVTATVRVTGYVDDVSSKVKIEGVVVSTIVGANGIYFDTIINVPTDGLINIEAADAAGNLAVPVEIRVSTPTPVVTAISSGDSVQCFIIGGKVKCMGQNFAGQLGDGTNTDSTVPVDVVGIESGATSVTSGYGTSCAVVNGAVKCWGQNYSNIPVAVGIDSGAIEVSSYDRTCAVVNNLVKCWGYGIGGVPVEVQGTAGATSVSVGANAACAVVNSSIKCWSRYNLNVQTVIGLESGATAVAVGRGFSCAVVNGAVLCWGLNDSGQLGDGTTVNSSTPVAVLGITSNATNVSASTSHACATVNGGVKCWGRNEEYQLGDLTHINRSYSVDAISENSNVLSVKVGQSYSCAVKNGAAYCWGLWTRFSDVPIKINGL